MIRFPCLLPIALLAGLVSSAPAVERPVVRSVDVVGTAFEVGLADGSVVTGDALVGAVISLALPGGAVLPVRIDSVEADPDMDGVTLYGFSFREAETGEWRNLCEPDANGVRKGFPMRGTLAADSEYRPEAPGFSITCVGGVQAKCVRWGYRPWAVDVNGVAMLDLYRTCMRMARADYCGDGRGFTRDGTAIDLFDVAGIQKPETASPLPFEAAWGPHGAVCVRHTRLPDVLTLDALVAHCPRLAGAVGESCGESAAGAVMFNRSR